MSDFPSKLQAARTRLSLVRPYISTALWNLHPIEVTNDPKLPTMGVDKYWRLYYNPEFVEKEDVEDLAGDLYHEIQHLFRNHHKRGSNYRLEDPIVAEQWQYASDAELNDDIIEEGIKIQDWVVTPQKLKMPPNKMAEEYMALFPPSPLSNSNGKPVGGKSGCGSGQGAPGGYELGPPDKDTPGVGTAEGDLIRSKVAEDIVKHEKNIGNVAGGLARWAKRFLNPQVDWRKELGASLRGTIAQVRGRMEYTFRYLSRRQFDKNIRLPSMCARIPNVAIQTDTSGSMGEGDLGAALAEVDGILRIVGIVEGVIHYSVDMVASNQKKVRRAKDIALSGGGGTDMGVGIKHAMTLRPRLDILVVLTDGETPWPKEEPVFNGWGPEAYAIYSFEVPNTLYIS